jgi:hypothetical protein
MLMSPDLKACSFGPTGKRFGATLKRGFRFRVVILAALFEISKL